MSRSFVGMMKGLVIAVISSLVVGLDVVTKMIIVERIRLYDSISVLPFLNIVHVENKGAAFSILSDMGNNYFIVISFIAISVIIVYLSKLSKGLELYAMSLILGGAIGNLIDRIRIGKVIDFIDIFVGRHHWPAFNVADSALTIGIILFLIATIRHGRASTQDAD